MPLPVQTATVDEEPYFGQRAPYRGNQYVQMWLGDTRITTIPDRPVVTRSGFQGLTLSWPAPANGGPAITQYRIYDAGTLSPIIGDRVAFATTASTTITLETSPVGFRVVAVNAVGEGIPSLPVT